MTKGERLAGSVALVALYLRGAPYRAASPRKRWPLVVDAVRRSCCDLSTLPEALRANGLWDEAATLDDAEAVAWAIDVCTSCRAITFLDPAYPQGWVESLGSGAPPCAWVRGDLPTAPPVAVVGSRVLSPADQRFATDVGRTLMATGRTLVSGGAHGADFVATEAALACGDAARCVELLPCGLERAPSRPGVCQLSVCEPWADFTTGQAMERNGLIYAFGRRAVVVRARWKAGGTWHGASDALRRRLAQVYVRPDDRAGRALVALGAVAASAPARLPRLWDAPLLPGEPSLFGNNCVRERRSA